MRRLPVTRAIGLAVVAGSIAIAAAQGQPLAPEAGAPALRLTPAQKVTIYQSVVTPDQRNNPAPPGFRAAVGMHVPDTIRLEPVSNTLATVIPEVKGYAVAMVEKQVVVVDPTSKTIVAVVMPQE